ncbi:MAG: hypothetical protein IJ192_11740 [Clostridia bacterium]|nr:hypothetical protein [Clostridia bacterium]
MGKSYLSAVFCVIRAILYPGSKIVIASGTRGQALNILSKITLELKPKSPALAFEISDKETKINGTDAQIVFKNGSFIKVVTSGESARGNRANILIIDEFRLVPKDTVDTILSKFLTSNRTPEYSDLSKAERKKAIAQETNKTLYLSSAYFSDSWAYAKCQSVFDLMLDDTKHGFVCGFPYQLAIAEDLLDAEAVADQMAETDFSEVKWSMEMGAEFFGAAEYAWFDFNSISRNRKIKYPMLPKRLSSKLNNNPAVRVVPKKPGEIRILSADIALMSSKKRNNDATSLFINQMTPTKAGRYISNIIYGDILEGAHTEDQARIIRMLFDEYDCDYLVIDAQGVGSGITDILMRDINDPESGEIYPALSCCNNPEMAERCTVPYAPKVIWAIKAGAQFNSDCAYKLREGFRSSRVRLLLTEYDGETALKELKGYNSLSDEIKTELQYPYYNTTLLIKELVKLQYEENNGRVTLRERSNMRKDRYSSLAYNYYVALQIENKMNKRQNYNMKGKDMFIIKPPNYKGRTVNKNDGYSKNWKGNRSRY